MCIIWYNMFLLLTFSKTALQGIWYGKSCAENPELVNTSRKKDNFWTYLKIVLQSSPSVFKLYPYRRIRLWHSRKRVSERILHLRRRSRCRCEGLKADVHYLGTTVKSCRSAASRFSFKPPSVRQTGFGGQLPARGDLWPAYEVGGCGRSFSTDSFALSRCNVAQRINPKTNGMNSVWFRERKLSVFASFFSDRWNKK